MFLFLLIFELLIFQNNYWYAYRKVLQYIIWMLFGVFMLAVNVSRLFIATHFPHQVVLGTLAGNYNLLPWNLYRVACSWRLYILIHEILDNVTKELSLAFIFIPLQNKVCFYRYTGITFGWLITCLNMTFDAIF